MLIHPLIDARNLVDPVAAILMLQRHHFGLRPVEVVGNKGYLLRQLL
ncbi:MAG: hypothetical protein MUF72_15655 [Elainella sp. Prado103]|jgi:hypothetical protein|nr:hypothetical protein [Elainella sp. Prado103]